MPAHKNRSAIYSYNPFENSDNIWSRRVFYLILRRIDFFCFKFNFCLDFNQLTILEYMRLQNILGDIQSKLNFGLERQNTVEMYSNHLDAPVIILSKAKKDWNQINFYTFFFSR